MIRLLEAQNFRMLARNRVSLARFHVLVGQNATGKTTFLDAIQFVSDVLRDGVRGAVESRAPSFRDLCFSPDKPVSFGLEVQLPDAQENATSMRYELEIGPDEENGGELRVLRENLFRMGSSSREEIQTSLFGADSEDLTILTEKSPKEWRKVASKTREGRDYFRDEHTEWNNMFRFGPDKAALGSLPEDPDRFPMSITLRDILRDGVQTLALDVRKLRRAAPPGGRARMELDGSNLPYVVRDLRDRDKVLFEQWVQHLATGVPGLIDIAVHEREDDKHLVLKAGFEGQHAEPVPSWLLSDGTLRLMALTLLSYAANEGQMSTYLIEEPENGLHPLAIQTAYEALADPAQGSQILCATHSPVLLAHTRLNEALVFRRMAQGHAAVRHGYEVPELQGWSDRQNISDLFATGILS